MIAKIATGEVEDSVTDDGKNAAAVALGRMGGRRFRCCCRSVDMALRAFAHFFACWDGLSAS